MQSNTDYKMKVKEIMTERVEYLPADTSIEDAAKKMAAFDCGFLPIAEENLERLRGVITDRDIAVRAVAEGLDPATTKVEEICSDSVLYCYENDDIIDTSSNMSEQKIWRIIVLDNQENKEMVGILTVGDILRKGEKKIAADTARKIMEAA